VEERWEHEGTLQGVMLRAGEASVALGQDDWKKGRDRQKGVAMRIFISTTQNMASRSTRSRPTRTGAAAPSR